VKLDISGGRRVSFSAPQVDAGFIHKGGKIVVKGKNKPLEVEITTVFPALDSRRMFRVEALLPKGVDIKTGSFVKLDVVQLRHENALVIPDNCLMKKPDGGFAVFVVKQNKLKLVTVEKLADSGGLVEVKGVNAGDKVVTSTFLGWANLADGLNVEVAK
jgi:multidrug efflux pump subunit AcrA (membrane-fusion protein)